MRNRTIEDGRFQVESADRFVKKARDWEHYSTTERCSFLLFAHMHACKGSVITDDFKDGSFESEIGHCIERVMQGMELDKALDRLPSYEDATDWETHFKRLSEFLAEVDVDAPRSDPLRPKDYRNI